MSGNAKFRWFLLAQFIVALLVVTPPNIPAQDIAGDTVKAYKNQIQSATQTFTNDPI